MSELPDYVLRNREAWSVMAAEFEVAGERNWATVEPSWGVWGVPESELRLLPDELDGKDAIELGCGTGYVSAWLARRGARVVGIDNSEAQLATARRLQKEHGIEFPLIHGNAETVPLPDESFDFAISEYGVCIWADPAKWVRLLRRSGFQIEDLIEIQAPEGATTTYPYFDYEWARKWPTEEVWKTSKKG